jgi:hypothetical protein
MHENLSILSDINIEIDDKTPIWQIRGLSLCDYLSEDVRGVLTALVTAYDAQNKISENRSNWLMPTDSTIGGD